MPTPFIERKLTNWLLRRTPASGVRKVISAFGAVASEIGNVRNDNQDKAVIVKSINTAGRPYVVAIVADGIGGMRDGAQCAALSIAAFISRLEYSSRNQAMSPERWLEEALHAANASVFQEYRGQGGSTFVALLLLKQDRIYWVSAGDSRLYRFSGRRLSQISTDDTIAGQLGKRGPVPAEHSKILQFVGMGKEFSPHTGSEPWQGETQYLLTTDGVHYLSESSEVYSKIIENSDETGVTAKRLIDLAKWCGGPDNATTSIIDLPQDPAELFPEQDDGLSVWDAFGELQIQVVPESIGDIEKTSPKISTKEATKEEPDGDDLSLIESDYTNPSKGEPETPPRKGDHPQKRNPRKKKPAKDEEKAQLDIKFSSNSDKD